MTAKEARELVRQFEAVDNVDAILMSITAQARRGKTLLEVEDVVMTEATYSRLKSLNYRVENCGEIWKIYG